ncbi:sialin isoform X2 [Dendroctonus ponderosae]|uniref:Major facilitator superfamily (MFS) profile domain-containing protein n=1 Tax=Dendroctonus ponderosae TaxID=77166 RepID=A0AAR5PDD9_DENPD|nr:sialin isoform X1 [Dendroctonus ponderosae]XP_019758903.2 sialin isoform X2 [Dendroctonus ponderosae]
MGFKIPIRFWIAVMVFASTYINYTTRSNMSISITSMVTRSKDKAIPECKRNETLQATSNANSSVVRPAADFGPRYDWDEDIQGFILGSYFWGYVISSAPGGFIAEWLGPFNTIFYAQIVTALFNSLSVYGAQWHFGVLICCRFVLGLMAGPIYPALQCLIARWAPPAEKGKFVSALMGNTLGTCLTWIFVGMVTASAGWDWGFHFLSIQIAVFCVVFWFIVDDSPDEHKWISEEEKKFIKDSQAKTISKGKAVPPYLKMFTSLPFWSLCILHFGNLWGLYLQITGVPKFMIEVIGFNIKASGGLAALPHLLRMFFGMGYGYLGDVIKSKTSLGTTLTRKSFVLFSHIIPGVLLMCMTLVKCDHVGAVLILIFSMSINGAAVVTNLQNAQDLAPNFAGSIFGIISLIGGTTGFITPAVTGALMKENNGINEWSKNFIIGGSVYIGAGLFFIIFGTTDIQPWNEKVPESGAADPVPLKTIIVVQDSEEKAEPNETTKLNLRENGLREVLSANSHPLFDYGHDIFHHLHQLHNKK